MVWSGRVIALLPFVVLAAIRTLSPQYLDVFNSTSGQLVLGACALSVVLGYGAMRWMSRLPIDERVLGLVMPLAKFLPYAVSACSPPGCSGSQLLRRAVIESRTWRMTRSTCSRPTESSATTLKHPSAWAGSG